MVEIETSSWVTYPCGFRVVEITKDNKMIISSKRVEEVRDNIGNKRFLDYAKEKLEADMESLVYEFVVNTLTRKGLSNN